jgi:prepilin-type N-terminal cleavage/methylation domain-containing protein
MRLGPRTLIQISGGPQSAGPAQAARRRGYTLLELLVVVTVLGIAGALVIPSMSQTGVLRVHAAVRTIVSDITFAQSDALTYQKRRAIIFTPSANSYVLTEVNGPTIDPVADALYEEDGPGQRYRVVLDTLRYNGAQIQAAAFDNASTTLIFDELGGPVQTPQGNTPGTGGTVTITGSGQTFVLTVEAYTGRVTVQRTTGP